MTVLGLSLLWILAAVIAGCSGDNGQLFIKNIPAPSLRGNTINEPVEQPIAVYLPPGYASDADKYPAVYFITGCDDDVDDLLQGTIQGESLIAVIDSLIDSGSITKMISIIINGRNVRGEGFFTQSDSTGRWDRFLVRDVVRYVDKHYKTLPFRETRGVAGFSTGGTAALQIAMAYPEVFSAVYAVSPESIGGVDDLVRAYADLDVELEGIVVEVGTEENEKIVKSCEYFSAAMNNVNAAHRLIQFEGEHSNQLKIRFEEHVLPFMAGVLELE
jgi:enterochelin esterase-like enzyme